MHSASMTPPEMGADAQGKAAAGARSRVSASARGR